MIWNVFGPMEKLYRLKIFDAKPPVEGGFLLYPSIRKTQVFRNV